MKITLLKGSNDKKSFKLFETLGAKVNTIDDLEKTDDKIQELIREDYTTIIMTSEVAGFSESIIKKYNRTNNTNQNNLVYTNKM